MSRPILYQAIGEIPSGIEFKPAQKDILDNWLNGNNLFSVGQIASRNLISRGASRRQIRALIKLGLVRVWYVNI